MPNEIVQWALAQKNFARACLGERGCGRVLASFMTSSSGSVKMTLVNTNLL